MSLDEQDKKWISEQLDELAKHLKAYVDERSEQVETKLLTEFHKWASTTDARSRTHSAAIRALDVEMEAMDYGLKKLEGRQ